MNVFEDDDDDDNEDELLPPASGNAQIASKLGYITQIGPNIPQHCVRTSTNENGSRQQSLEQVQYTMATIQGVAQKQMPY